MQRDDPRDPKGIHVLTLSLMDQWGGWRHRPSTWETNLRGSDDSTPKGKEDPLS